MKKLKYAALLVAFALVSVALLLFAVLADFDDGLGIYKVQTLDAELGEDTWLQHAYNVEGTTYLTATYTAKTETGYESGIALFSIDEDGEIHRLKNFPNSFEKSENGVKFTTYSGIIPTENGKIWGILREHSEEYSPRGSVLQSTAQKLICTDSAGTQLSEYDLTTVLEELNIRLYAEQLFFGSRGEIILYGTGKTVVLDRNGKLTAHSTLPENAHLENLVQLHGGGVVGIQVTETERAIVKINPDNAKVEKVGKLPIENAANIYPASRGNRILIASNSALYSYNLNLGRLKLEINWINSGINPARLTVLSQLSQDSLLVYEATPEYEGTKLLLLTKVEKEELPESKLISYAALSVDETAANAIIGYNNSQTDYRIVVADYSVYNTNEDMTAGAKKLLQNIEKGKNADVINLSQMDRENLISNNALLDLQALFPQNNGEYYNNVIEASKKDGKLYGVVADFSLECTLSETQETILVNNFESTLPEENFTASVKPQLWLGVAKNTAYPDKAAEFIEYFVNNSQNKNYFSLSKNKTQEMANGTATPQTAQITALIAAANTVSEQ